MQTLNVEELTEVSGGAPILLVPFISLTAAAWSLNEAFDIGKALIKEIDWGEARYEDMMIAP